MWCMRAHRLRGKGFRKLPTQNCHVDFYVEVEWGHLVVEKHDARFRCLPCMLCFVNLLLGNVCWCILNAAIKEVRLPPFIPPNPLLLDSIIILLHHRSSVSPQYASECGGDAAKLAKCTTLAEAIENLTAAVDVVLLLPTLLVCEKRGGCMGVGFVHRDIHLERKYTIGSP